MAGKSVLNKQPHRVALVTGAWRLIRACMPLMQRNRWHTALTRIPLPRSSAPGWVANEMGGPGGRPVGDGAAGVVWAATLPDDGPTGGFFRDQQPIDW